MKHFTEHSFGAIYREKEALDKLAWLRQIRQDDPETKTRGEDVSLQTFSPKNALLLTSLHLIPKNNSYGLMASISSTRSCLRHDQMETY